MDVEDRKRYSVARSGVACRDNRLDPLWKPWSVLEAEREALELNKEELDPEVENLKCEQNLKEKALAVTHSMANMRKVMLFNIINSYFYIYKIMFYHIKIKTNLFNYISIQVIII